MIRIGSRGSQLALWQAEHIAAALRSLGQEVSIEVIRTTGDRMQGVAFAKVGTKGMFTKEIEEALFDGRVDLAVHSLKDLPTVLDPAFVLAAIPPRADPRDAFISSRFASFAELPPGAKVGTSSLRRQAQLRGHRGDLEFVEFRGNVDTRLRKLASGEVEACVLASAGLDRLGYTDWLRERFDASILCPAPGQGALAVETRASDSATGATVALLDDADTRFAVTAERAALHALGGGCQVPIGIYCARVPGGNAWSIAGVVTNPGGSASVRVEREHQHTREPVALGESLAELMLAEGAAELLEGTPAAERV
jgi:hydroxymethylbilane synthase